MAEPSYDECLVDAELRARAAYSEPHRQYHDQRHLDDCLAELRGIRGVEERDRRLLKWAILWHDAVYEPGRQDNEERSAELAQFELNRCGIPEFDSVEVARLIRLTEKHKVDDGNRLGALMVSIDLSILGAEPETYRRYADDVRREYSHVPDPIWRGGRSEVLKRMLARSPLYPDEGFRERLEEQARSNLEAELRALAEG